MNGVLSKTDQIERHEHTGFDDRQKVESLAGLFVPYFTTLNFTLGVVCTAKQSP